MIYQAKNGESQKERFEKSVVPMLVSQVGRADHLFLEIFRSVVGYAGRITRSSYAEEWNLMFPKGTLICNELIQQQHPVPIKYPIELEEKAKQAILQENKDELKKCFWKLGNCYKEEFHMPADIKQAIIQFSLFVFGVYKAKVSVELDLAVQNIMQEITIAVSWEQLETALKTFFRLFEFETEKKRVKKSVSWSSRRKS